MVRARGLPNGALDWNDADTRGALARLATKDLLSATIATYFLNDMFGSMVGPLWTWAGIPDRNAVLEHTFETIWNCDRGFALPPHVSAGFLGARFAAPGAGRTPIELLPHLLLNGTDLGSGKRMITSTIRWTQAQALFPDSGDFVRLASRDVRLLDGGDELCALSLHLAGRAVRERGADRGRPLTRSSTAAISRTTARARCGSWGAQSSMFPQGIQVGMQFERATEGGDDEMVYTITDIEGDKVVVDGNDPLAGTAQVFNCTIADVRAATAEELTHGHVHGPEGHHHH